MSENQKLTQNQSDKEDEERELDFYDINFIKQYDEANDNKKLDD